MTTEFWQKITVGDLESNGEAEIKTGPFGTQLHASDYVNEGTPVINVRNIGFGTIRAEKLEFINNDTVNRLSTHLLRAGDIVFGRKGAVERHVLIGSRQDRWFQGSDCLRIRVKSREVRNRFLSYHFLTEHHKQWMMNHCSHGATMASLNQEIIRRIPLAVPPPATQDKIISILSAYDDLIENNLRRIKILEEMAQALYREWFVKFRFPGHEKVRMVESAVGEIPEGWGVRSFAEVGEFINGFAFKPTHWQESGKPIVKIKELKNGVTSETPRYHGEDIKEKYHISDGCLLFSWSADLDAYIWNGGDALLNQHLFNVVPRDEYSRVFLYFSLKESMNAFRSRSLGTTMRHIKRSALDEVKASFPPANLRQRFEEQAIPILGLVQNLVSKNRGLRRTRDLLLPKLISGDLDVSNLDIAIPEKAA